VYLTRGFRRPPPEMDFAEDDPADPSDPSDPSELETAPA
jgi:hypothetical protein